MISEALRSSAASSLSISIVVVTYNAGDGLVKCLRALANQGCSDFETVVVDNGNVDPREIEGFDVRYVKLGRNYGPSYARNCGAQCCRGEVVVFLDDDAVAGADFVQAWHTAFQDDSLVAARGRVIPIRKHAAYNSLAGHYDLGASILDSAITTEGNCAVRKSDFVAVGGFNSRLFGHEGVELSYRLAGRGKQIYVPYAVVYHDYADNLHKLLAKHYRSGYNKGMFTRAHPEVVEYIAGFKYPARAGGTTRTPLRKKSVSWVVIALARGVEAAGGLAYRARSWREGERRL